jgi:hypothetical protein
MEIFFDSRDMKSLIQSIEDAIEEGDNEILKNDLIDMFSDEQIEEIERRLDTSDFQDFIDEILDEWSGEEPIELVDLLAMRLGEIGVDLRYETEEEEEEEEGIEDLDEEEELDVGEDEEEEEYDEDEEEEED